jgi:hypothetical protein
LAPPPLALLPSSLSASLVAPGPLLLLVPLASLAALVAVLQVQLARPLRRARPECSWGRSHLGPESREENNYVDKD